MNARANPLRRLLIAVALAWAMATSGGQAAAAPRLKVLIVDGVNNHDWPATTAKLAEMLRASGRFDVEVATSPPRGAPAEDWAQWRPMFERHDAVLSNFNGGHAEDAILWPAQVRRDFEAFVRGGGGFVSFHAANNSFPGWAAYEEMVGLLWRDKSFGPSLYFDESEAPVIVPAGSGLEPGHGPRHDFTMTTLATEHPIMRGFPKHWGHVAEQLTHGQHGPDSAIRSGAFTFLTCAWSKDSQAREPMDWVRRYGRGRVYVTMLGHTWAGEENPNLASPGFRAMLLRGVEWAASGQVTIPLPADLESAAD